jgi:hypothetical protein
MPTVGITIRRNDFAKMGPVARAVISQIVKDHADNAVREAQRLCPEVTGKLKESIRVEPMASGATVARITAFGNRDTGESYAAFVELGTVHHTKAGKEYSIPAHPFLRPAIEAEIPLLNADLQNLEPRLVATGTVVPVFKSS